MGKLDWLLWDMGQFKESDVSEMLSHTAVALAAPHSAYAGLVDPARKYMGSEQSPRMAIDMLGSHCTLTPRYMGEG